MKRFLKKTLLVALVPTIYFVLIAIYNIVIDPYGVIRGDMNNQVIEPNKRYLKQKFILNNKDQFNAFLFGNSRVAKIDVGKINDHNNWYNMSYSEGLPKEHYEDIQFLLSLNVKINKVIIGIDELSCLIPPSVHENDALRKPYEDFFNPLLDYLFLFPSPEIYEEIKKANNANPPPKGRSQSIYTNGSDTRVQRDQYIESNIERHLNDTVFQYPYWHAKSSKEHIDPAVHWLEEIYKLCNERNIELVLFVNPIYEVSYKKAVEDGLLIFLEQVIKIVDLYDFSGIYDTTTNKINYYEASHYRPHVGDFIVKELNSTNSSFLVKKQNAEEWLNSKYKEAKNNEINLLIKN